MTDTPELDEHTELQLAAARARRRLSEAPAVIGWVRAQITPTMGGAQDGMPRAASKTAPLPFRADAVDEADQAFARILDWVSYWAGLYEEQPPALIQAHWRVAGETQGFRAGVTVEGATALVRAATIYLLTRHDRIQLHEAARTYYDDAADIVWQLRAKFPTAPRPSRGVLDRPCPVCDHFNYGAEWGSQDVTDFTLTCSHCGHTEPGETFVKNGRVRELLHELREEHAEPKSEWWTKRQAVLELGMTMRTLDRWIVDGLATYTAGGTVHVNVEDTLDRYRSQRLRAKETRMKPREPAAT